MASFSNTPPDIIGEIINALSDDINALKACSQTCSSLLPSCRKCLFRTIHITPRSYPQRSLPRLITLFGTLLDTNPGISDHVQNFVYRICTPDVDDDDVLRVLGRLRRIQSFELGARDRVISWKALRQPFRDALLRLIHSGSISRLEIANIHDFPINAFFPCVNLVDLTLLRVTGSAVGIDDDEQGEEVFVPKAAPRLRSFAFSSGSGQHVLHLLKDRRSNGNPVLNFCSVRRLSVKAENEQDSVVIQALIRATQKVEVIEYTVNGLINGYAGLAVALMNTSSLSTLRKLRLEYVIVQDDRDPLYGLCEEFRGLSGRDNVIEEVSLEVAFQKGHCNAETFEWGRLDAALKHGFPMLRHVSLNIAVGVLSFYGAGEILQRKLDGLPGKCLPWLSKNTTVMFSFSTSIK